MIKGKKANFTLRFFMKQVAIIFLLLGTIVSKAQQNAVVTGGNASSNNGSVSYSVGQVDFVSLSNTTNVGVQQSYDNSISLPITGLVLTASKKGKEVLLNWETTTEINSSHFIVQRFTNNRPAFDSIGIVSAKGNSNSVSKYSLSDKLPVKGTNYYRLKQVDKDGKFIYSATVAVNFDGDFTVSCYPNPTTHSIKLDVGITDTKGYSYQLFDLNGKLVSAAAITSSITTINLESLKAATYIIKVMNNNTESVSITVIKK